VTPENVPLDPPPERLKLTAEPPVVRLFPEASLACKVTVEVAPAKITAGVTLTVDLAKLIDPAVTVTVGKAEVRAFPAIVAPILVAVPAKTPVKLAV